MLDKNSLINGFELDTKTIQVKAWEKLGDNEVKIRRLSLKESSYINDILLDGASPKDGTFSIQINKLQKAQIETVFIALVEPKLTRRELEKLSDNAQSGIVEIYNAITEFDKSSGGK